MKKFLKSDGMSSFLSSVVAVIVGLLVGFIVILIANPHSALLGLNKLILGGFSNGSRGLGQVINASIPIIMTGLSVGFAFKTGLFNIGGSGQFVMGAFVAIYIGVEWTFLPGILHWVVAIIAAALVGALWGLIPGILKAYFNVNEVISCIMMNYIGMYTVNFLVPFTVYNSLTNQTLPVASSAVISDFGLDNFIPTINGGIVIAIIFVIIMHIILNKTTFGYELKACGHNPDASKYIGINSKQKVVLSMVIAGALSAIGGALLYLGGTGRCLSIVDTLADEGFNGIAVALLGLSNPIGVGIAGLFIAHITIGGSNMQLYGYIPEIVNIIIAVIIYFSALSLIIKQYIMKGSLFKSKKNVNKEVEVKANE